MHHRHTFSRWDPLRPLSRLVLPEGFPAHAHRGFETVTIVLSIMHMFDSEALTVTVKPNPEIEAARITWATRVLRELYDRRAS